MADSKTTCTIETRQGPVVARAEGDGSIRVRGLPYGRAERFREGQPLPPWTEPLDCTARAAICPQLPFDFEFILGDIDVEDKRQREDCLSLTILTSKSALDAPAKLPVFVYIHGGAYISGGADLDVFDGRALAARGVVVINVQYRLGIFGGLLLEGIGTPNLTLLDQIMALKWIHANIDSFGGDKTQITIAGQSAGGFSVYSILLSEIADGLYNKAVVISAPFGVPVSKTTFRKQISDKAKELMGNDWKEKSTKDLLDVQKAVFAWGRKHGNLFAVNAPVAGEHPLPPTSEFQSRLQTIASRVELLMGWTADDCLPFIHMIPNLKPIQNIPLVGRPLFVLLGKLATGSIFGSGAQSMHAAHRKAGGTSTTFTVEWFPEGGRWRACHSIELPLMFGTWEVWKEAPLMQGTASATPQGREALRTEAERLGAEVKDLFAEFAKGRTAQLAGSHIRINKDFVLRDLLGDEWPKKSHKL